MTHGYETATDNFAHIIAVRKAKADQIVRWEEFNAKSENWGCAFNLIAIVVVAGIIALTYFMS